MKKNVIFITVIVTLVLAVSVILHYKTFVANNELAAEPDVAAMNQEITDNETKLNDAIVEISIEDIKGITQREAEELCYSVLGDKDEDTGFFFSFGSSGAVERKGKQYYVIRASWLVNNNHFSYIGDFFVSADGKEIYNGLVGPDGYIMTDIIWHE